MKILVTGATGFIGSRLVASLVEKGGQVRVLLRDGSDPGPLKDMSNVEIYRGDITRPSTLDGIEKGIDEVYHLAGAQGKSGQITDDRMFFDINVTGSLNLLRRFAGRGIRKFLFTSSTAAVGPIRKTEILETDAAAPITPYGKSKLEAERAIGEFSEKNGIPSVIVRPTHVYGPGDVGDLYTIVRLVARGIFPQVGTRPNLFPCVYIDDAVTGLLLAMEKGRPGEIYFITGSSSPDVRVIRRIVQRNLGTKRRFYPVLPLYPTLLLFSLFDVLEKRPGISFRIKKKNILNVTSSRRFSIEKARRELGYAPKLGIEEGLEKTIRYYRERGLL